MVQIQILTPDNHCTISMASSCYHFCCFFQTHINIGWKTINKKKEYSLVSDTRGGGMRTVPISDDATLQDVIEIGKTIFRIPKTTSAVLLVGKSKEPLSSFKTFTHSGNTYRHYLKDNGLFASKAKFYMVEGETEKEKIFDQERSQEKTIATATNTKESSNERSPAKRKATATDTKESSKRFKLCGDTKKSIDERSQEKRKTTATETTESSKRFKLCNEEMKQNVYIRYRLEKESKYTSSKYHVSCYGRYQCFEMLNSSVGPIMPETFQPCAEGFEVMEVTDKSKNLTEQRFEANYTMGYDNKDHLFAVKRKTYDKKTECKWFKDDEIISHGPNLYVWYPEESGNYKCKIGDDEYTFGRVTQCKPEDIGEATAKNSDNDNMIHATTSADDKKNENDSSSKEEREEELEMGPSKSKDQKSGNEATPFENVYTIPSSEVKMEYPAIGKGSFGIVYKGDWNGTAVAVKMFKKKNMRNMIASSMDTILEEIRVHKSLVHPNIVLLLGVYISPKETGLVSEFISGKDLDVFLHEGNIKGERRVPLVKQITCAVVYMHSRKVIHKDIKPENILVSNDQNCAKLCDYGISQIIKSENSGYTQVVSKEAIWGTPAFMLPETHLLNTTPSLPSDVWSLGCTLVELLTNSRIWGKLGIHAIAAKMENKRLPDSTKKLKAQFKKGIMAWDPLKRISASDFMKNHVSKWN